ncbi:microcin C transport system permease protein [Roseiarcus fermentans]|uniref:Microcin C transport system permease protein n=1 Tax=Roseiarcus fermentans TaxID=1473586 RepID=A0A366F966_9HYPH|nr:microcin C transport system permease protein [Roseiarcus fermentans]
MEPRDGPSSSPGPSVEPSSLDALRSGEGESLLPFTEEGGRLEDKALALGRDPAVGPGADRRWLNLSPMNRRRLDNFRRNRRGAWSLLIFLVLFVASLGAEFLANDRPLVASYKGQLLFPVFVNYPEDMFGGFQAQTDYRDPFVADEIKAHGWMIWPPVRFANSTTILNPATPLPTPPTWALTDAQCRAALGKQNFPDAETVPRPCSRLEPLWLGSDQDGHDIVARLLYGFRISVLFGLILAGVSSVIGVFAGAVQGYFGGLLDLVMQRVIEIWSSLPHLYILIILSAILAPSFVVLLVILLLFSWVSLVHVVRAEFLRARNFEYVNAARALGLSNAKIIVKHVLPNAMVATLTFLPFIINSSISTLTSLDFLGLGMPPGSPSLGELLLQGKSNLAAPWIGVSAFVVIAALLSLLIFIGEAVRDAFDPRKTFS